MSVKPERIRKLNDCEYTKGPIVYWMKRENRVKDNWSLLYAHELATAQKVPLLIVATIVPNFLGSGLRQHLFKIEALESVADELSLKNIPFFVIQSTTPHVDIVSFLKKYKAGALITDFFPLHLPKKWTEYICAQIQIPLYEVDAHNIVPCFIASPKQEYGAYTLRPKIHQRISEYLEEFPPLTKHLFEFSGKIPLIHWAALKNNSEVNAKILPVDWIHGDRQSAERLLSHFIKNKLPFYATDRNDPNKDAQSNLSPHLHNGTLSPQRVALAILKHVGAPIEKILRRLKNKADLGFIPNPSILDHAGAFLEELIVRRELSDNFCFYTEDYDTVDGFPAWAKKSHATHTGESREYLYTKKQFESAHTHDPLWNAAQQELISSGKLHGYMRMYWAKKILEWTKSPEQAMKIAIYLNDTYALDGGDPNGYAGIAWSIGGVHDRAWFERPVFGQIRYMNANGCKSKFNTTAYINKWTPLAK